jgi:hypothetical protein
VIALKKKPKAINCSDHSTSGLIESTVKIVAGIHRRIENKNQGCTLGRSVWIWKRKRK